VETDPDGLIVSVMLDEPRVMVSAVVSGIDVDNVDPADTVSGVVVAEAAAADADSDADTDRELARALADSDAEAA